jgi:hypothetical protein
VQNSVVHVYVSDFKMNVYHTFVFVPTKADQSNWLHKM